MRFFAVLLLLCAFMMFGLGVEEDFPPAFLMGLVTGIGGLLLWDRGGQERTPPVGISPELERRLQRLEEQLATTREELAASTVDLARLKEERDFLRQLYPVPPVVAERLKGEREG